MENDDKEKQSGIRVKGSGAAADAGGVAAGAGGYAAGRDIIIIQHPAKEEVAKNQNINIKSIISKRKRLLTMILILGVLLLSLLRYWALAPDMTPFPGPISGQIDYNNSIGMKFIQIPAGEFDIGSPLSEKDRKNDENIQHVKITNGFWMGVYEVTQKQWMTVVGNNPSFFHGDDLPVENVSWDDAQDFIEKLNKKEGTTKYRLPSETEWEYAARAGTNTTYPFGNDESKLGEYAWYDGNSIGKTHLIGQRKPNPWGLYDMHGNVWEWVQDTYHENYTDAPKDGSVWESSGHGRVNRGGAWNREAKFCRSAYRGWLNPGRRLNNVGFRLVRSL